MTAAPDAKRTFIASFTALLFSLFLTGCFHNSSSSGSGSSSELLFISDGVTLISARVTGSTSTEVGSADITGIPGSYTRSGTTVTVVIPNHDLPGSGYWVELVFSAGSGGTATSGLYQVTVIDADTFEVTDTVSGTITAGVVHRKPTTTLAATYTQSASTTVTVTLTDHNIPDGSDVDLDFTSGTASDTTTRITVVDANTFTVTVSASATTSGNVNVTVGGNYAIFGIAMHPTGNWVYVTSTYECWNGTPFCWGNGLISRFAVDWNTGALTFEESFIADVTGRGTPVDLNFSADGTLLFNQDDDLDGILMWSVNTTNGDLTLLASDGGTSLHGVGVAADTSRVYNGSNVFTVDTMTPAITNTSFGSGCNTSLIIGTTIYCADAGSVLTYSLADPDAPSLITSIGTDNQEAREVAVSMNGARIVSSGWCGLRSYGYDGANITPSMTLGSNEYIDCGGSWLSSGTRKMFRTVSINAAGNMIATAYFTNVPSTRGGQPPTGYMLVSLDTDGALALEQDYPNTYYSRVARFFSRP